jgi:cell fate regulator YaaT (PSP1 superfamily)
MKKLYKVEIDELDVLTCVALENVSLKKNDFCLIQLDHYVDYGRVISASDVDDDYETEELPILLKHATLVDQGKANENRIRSKSMVRKVEACILKHELPMTLVAGHLSFDRNLSVILFTAPGRVDFRSLLKDLNNELKTRVELRQIGPRDQAAMVGGIGSCGRELCCSSFLTNFVSINIKMAKVQNISLNPSNIIGACGRLKCCLEYEYDNYKIMSKEMPSLGSACNCAGCGKAKIIETDPLNRRVTILAEETGQVLTVSLDDVQLL